jgi:hypothetical protein
LPGGAAAPKGGAGVIASPALPGGAAAPKGGAGVIDEILAKGRRRQKRLELWLGVLILGGGVAFKLGISGLTSREMSVATYGVIALGLVLIARGLFGQGRGEELPTNAVLRSLDPDRAHARPPSRRP